MPNDIITATTHTLAPALSVQMADLGSGADRLPEMRRLSGGVTEA